MAPSGVYSNVEGWVFNNLVLFSSAKTPAVPTVPNWVFDCPGHYIEPKGLECSPVRLGVSINDLLRLGYMRMTNDGTTFFYPVQFKALEARGVGRMDHFQDSVTWVILETGFIPTTAGARVGMTVGQVKAIYGTTFAVVPKKNDGVEGVGRDQYFGTYREGEYELQFRVKGKYSDTYEGVDYYEYAPTRPLVDSDVIAEIKAQLYTDDVSSYLD